MTLERAGRKVLRDVTWRICPGQRWIRQLLRFREDPVRCSNGVRTLAQRKCEALGAQRQALEQMHRELTLLLNLCTGAADHCPILEKLESE